MRRVLRDRRYSLFLTFRPPGLFATQVSPTSAQILPTQGSCDFYTRAKIRTVTGTGIGHPSRPNQAIDGKRTSTFLDLQPCRPPSRDFHPQSTSAFSRRTCKHLVTAVMRSLHKARYRGATLTGRKRLFASEEMMIINAQQLACDCQCLRIAIDAVVGVLRSHRCQEI